MVSALRFAFDIFWQALILSILWMGTSLLSVIVKIFIVPSAVLIGKALRQGLRPMWNRAKENLTDAAIATALAWAVLIGINAFWVIPHRIRNMADSIRVPSPKPPPVPGFAYETTPKNLGTSAIPKIGVNYKLMPFNPPYPAGTVVAGIQFLPNTFDVRFYLSIQGASIRNLDITVELIDTTGQLLAIRGMGQETTFAGVTMAPVGTNSSSGISSITVIGPGGKTSTIPLGGSTPSGSLQDYSKTWRIHCEELLANTTTEFVLMVDRPHRTKMIEGFRIEGSYDYTQGGKVKTAKVENITKFDELGKPHKPTAKEIEAILKYKSPFTGTTVFHLPPPQAHQK